MLGPPRIRPRPRLPALGLRGGEWMREILSQSPSPQIELEVLAMLRLASPPAADEVIRLCQLITSGHRTDGITLRAMVRYRRKDERNLGLLLSDIIEGEAEVPSTL